MTWSRRDQIQANQFLHRRSVSALVLTEPDSPDSPTSRPLLSALSGLTVLILVVAGFGVYGLLRPGSATSWRTPGAIVMQKDTGTRYLLAQDGRLHPVLNYASARLILGAERPKNVSVSAKSLRGVPRGRPVGIMGAPDTLPDARSLLTGPWTACSLLAVGGTPTTSVLVGMVPGGPEPTADQGLLVRDRKGTRYLLAGGKRWRIPGADVAAALNYNLIEAVAVADSWLDTVPAGADLGFPPVERRGARPRWAAPAGVRIGQVLSVTSVGTSTRLFLTLPEGLRELSETEAALVLGDPAAKSAYAGEAVQPVPVQAASLAAAPAAPQPVEPAGYPQRPPAALRLEDPDKTAICAVVSPGSASTAAVRLRLAATGALAALRPLPATVSGREAAVRPGGGVLVRTATEGGTVFLVTDQGIRHAVPDDARAALGYGGTQPIVLPSRLVEQLSAGPSLDRATATREWNGQSPVK